MPWMVQKDGDRWCVCKENDDGSAGEQVDCYDTEDKANEQLKALYANASAKEKMQAAFHGAWSAIKKAFHLANNESLDQKITAVRDSFYQTFDRLYSEPIPGCWVKEVYDGYVVVEEGEKLFKVNYNFDDDGNVVFDARDQWQPVEMQYVSMQSQFSFTELSADTLVEPIGLKYIDGLAAGTFVSMSGEEVTFEPTDLQSYIENTQKIIESTRTESGEIVGLPIDKDKHDHAGGAGWIVGLELDSARNVIRFLVNWTQDGIDLIKGNIRRFFSPSTDPSNKVILGGSLTNWPATRLETGQILLRPVELSQSIKEIDMPKTIEGMFEDLKAGLLEAIGRQAPTEQQSPTPAESDPTSPALKELLNTPEAVEELGKRATEIAQDAMRADKRKQHAVEFASRIVGGTKKKPFGLRVKPADVVALLLSLPEPQAKAVEKILEQSLDAAIDFAEHGFDSEGFLNKPQLPTTIKPYAEQWVKAGKPIAGFFAANPELGSPDQYNLAEFTTGKE